MSASVALWLFHAPMVVLIRVKFCTDIKQEMVAATCKDTANSFYFFPFVLELKEAVKVVLHFSSLCRYMWLRNFFRFPSKKLGAPMNSA